jgi:hypothetical protein
MRTTFLSRLRKRRRLDRPSTPQPPRAVVVNQNANAGSLQVSKGKSKPIRAVPVSGPTLRIGSRGDHVRRLQQLLNSHHGLRLATDGVMGPRTLAAVRQFQQSRQLSADGIVGKRTWGALYSNVPQNNVPPKAIPVREAKRVLTNFTGPVSHPHRRASSEQAVAHYKGLLGRQGVKVQSGKTYVLGLRGLSPDGSRSSTTDGNSLRHTNRQRNSYNDSFVVLRPKRNGQHQHYVFQGATYPGQSRSSRSPDANGDKVGDVGMVRPGVYKVRPNGEFYGASSYRVRKTNGSTRLPAWRDTNHDGDYSQSERSRSQRRGNTMSGILFHQGDPASPNSIGCQTLAPTEFNKFIQAVGGDRASFTYALIDAGR